MKRREFLTTAAYGAGAAWLASKMTGRALAMPELTKKVSASDTVVLGNTAIRTSRLANCCAFLKSWNGIPIVCMRWSKTC